jgi:hypothetical protein
LLPGGLVRFQIEGSAAAAARGQPGEGAAAGFIFSFAGVISLRYGQFERRDARARGDGGQASVCALQSHIEAICV